MNVFDDSIGLLPVRILPFRPTADYAEYTAATGELLFHVFSEGTCMEYMGVPVNCWLVSR